MKSILSYILIGVLLTVLVVPAQTLFAQTTTPSTANTAAAVAGLLGGGNAASLVQGAAALVDPAGAAGSFVITGIAVITEAVLKILALLVWISGTTLNFVLKYTIIDMSVHINGGTDSFGVESSPMTGINTAWKVIKDLMNIAFIFLLVYEGIKMIIGVSKDGAKTLIVGIVSASLLINFSLFFTKIIIDASNIVTIGFYNSVIDDSMTLTPRSQQGASATGATNPTDTATSVTVTDTPDRGVVEGLSVPFMKALGVGKFWSTEAFQSLHSSANADKNIIIYNIAGSILFIVTSFSFLAVSAMFVIRYITLIFLLMLSPIGYMGLAIPQMRTYATQWWGALNSQILFAPLYMLMTWIALTLLSSPGFITLTGDGDWAKLVVGENGQGNVNSIGLIFNFVLVIGLIIMTLKVSHDVSKKGSSLIGDATKWATGAAGGLLAGGAARIGRNTIGLAGNTLANSEKLKNTAVNGNAFTKNFAKLSLKAGDKAATSNFDVRNTTLAGSLSKTTGINMGKTNPKDNFRTTVIEPRAKEAETFAKMLKPSDSAVYNAKQNAKNAQEELNSAEFKAKEESVKKEWFESDEYLKSVEALQHENNAKEAKLAEDNLNFIRVKTEKENKDKKQEIQSLNKLKAESKNPLRTAELEKQIKDAEEVINANKTQFDSASKNAQEKQKAYEASKKTKEEWASEGKKSLLDDVAKGKDIDAEYGKRVEKYASSFEDEPAWLKITKNLGRVATGGAPVLLSTNVAIAKKIRGAKEKSKKERAKDLLLEAEKEEAEEKKKSEGGGDTDKKEEKKEEPKTT